MTRIAGGPLKAALARAVALAFVAMAGCAGPSGIHDAYALSQAKKVAVLPAVGAPGPDGTNAGPMQTGLLITALSDLKHFDVSGPGELRKALSASTRPAVWERKLQTDLAGKLGIDLLVLAEVVEYRFTKQWKSSSVLVAASRWTESTYHAAVAVRLVCPTDGRLVYSGSGSAESRGGYGPALVAATNAALQELKLFLAAEKQKRS